MSILATWTFAASGNGTGIVIMPRKGMQMNLIGGLGGGTVTFEASFNNGTTYIACNDTSNEPISLTAAGVYGGFHASQGTMVRAVLTGATTPTLTVMLQETV